MLIFLQFPVINPKILCNDFQQLIIIVYDILLENARFHVCSNEKWESETKLTLWLVVDPVPEERFPHKDIWINSAATHCTSVVLTSFQCNCHLPGNFVIVKCMHFFLAQNESGQIKGK